MVKLIVNKIRKSYGKQVVLEDISFECVDEIVFIAGKNGVGKTTFIRLALGLDRPTSGEIHLLEDDEEIGNENIGVVMDTPALFTYLSGKRNIDILCAGYLKDRKYVERILNELELDRNLLSKKISKFSFGQKHRLSVAIALIRKPKILFLDEPTIGLDPVSWGLVKKTIHNNKKELGGCVIVTGQDYFEMKNFADKILIIKDGMNCIYDDIQSFLDKFPNQLIITTNNEDLPNEIKKINVYKEYTSNGINYYFDAKFKESVVSLFAKYKIGIDNLLVREITLKDAFLQIANGKEYESEK
ncbi:MAG: ABC transporter ATP-binding protein [Lachnospiraceae bacterium]|nr:ABC transporter ATP-binding protein [Lachnospiraceae bacterium]